MKNPMEEKAYLLLEDGSFFEGFTAGAKGTVSGEICFNTGMTGYQEIFTDPSYYGQIMTIMVQNQRIQYLKKFKFLGLLFETFQVTIHELLQMNHCKTICLRTIL